MIDLEDVAFDVLADCGCDTYGDHREKVMVVLAKFRGDVLREGAERIRNGDGASVEYGEAICHDLIDPEKEQP